MKSIIAILLFCSFSGFAQSNTKSIHDYQIKLLNSEKMLDFADFKGKKILVVNVASKCGYTPQYEELEALSKQYGDKLVVVGFPCDQFMSQELDTEAAIAEFCSAKFDVSFPMTTIINVKGKEQHPIYQYLTQKALNGLGDFEISWNFNKFLLDEAGKVIAYFPSKVTPMDAQITKYLK
jgi:glutathione peroxidase